MGTRKRYLTFLDETAIRFSEIAVSTGERGRQMLLPAERLADYVGGQFLNFTKLQEHRGGNDYAVHV